MRQKSLGGLVLGFLLFAVVAGGAGKFDRKLPKDQKIIHALNRLTFGPGPGDVERVKRMGLAGWIDLQLSPQSIDENPMLATKLEPLDSLEMNLAEVASHYPPPQFIKAVAEGKAKPPSDPDLAAVIERLAERYTQAKTAKEQGKKPNPALREMLSPQQWRTLRRGSQQERVDLLLKMEAPRLSDLLFELPKKTRRGMFAYAPVDLRRRMLLTMAPQELVVNDLLEGKLYRAIYSNRQLEEVLVDFWFNHFNVYLNKGPMRHLTIGYERDAIRPHVLGSFGDMLLATARHPAMLFYLDNWQSVDPEAAARIRKRRKNALKRVRGLNENYARELLELHTLGVDGGYTQQDVIEVARCFTGWSIEDPRHGGGFRFNYVVHDRKEKTVLGHTIPAGGGIEDGLAVIDILVRHPSTARFISTKLAQRFVADNPPEKLVRKVTETFRKTEGDLREVMRTMLTSRQFFSTGAYRAKVKSPLETVVSAVRALDADVTFARGLAYSIEQMGQPLFRKEEPTGYSNVSDAWLNSATLLERLNFAQALAANKLPGSTVDLSSLGAGADEVAAAILWREVSQQTRQSIAGRSPEITAALVLGSPEFQRR